MVESDLKMKKALAYTIACLKARYGMGLFSLMLLFSLSAFAETEGINFQGLARNASDVATSLAAKVDKVTGKEFPPMTTPQQGIRPSLPLRYPTTRALPKPLT